MTDTRHCVTFIFAALLMLLACPIDTHAQTFTYQGFLSNASGAPQAGSFDLTFRLYAASTGGDQLWQEAHQGVTTDEGRFSVELGIQDPQALETVVRAHPDLWLGITLGDGHEMEPRQRLGASPRAIRAIFADSVATGTVTGEMIAEGSVPLDRLAAVCEQGQHLVMGIDGWECAEEDVCTPGPEVCDGADNDCDGQVDEDFTNLGNTCSVGTGSCSKFGLFVCTVDGGGIECGVSAGEPSPELCDGLDNDCDGQVDEDFTNLGNTCSVGAGSCSRSGLFVCAADGAGIECGVSAGEPSPELCDGLDNDCDDLIDEDYRDPQGRYVLDEHCGSCNYSCIGRLPNASSICSVVGNQPMCVIASCDQDQVDLNLNPIDGCECQVTAEICDGLDNDCDGQVDEDFTNLGNTCSVGAGSCSRSGLFVCAADGAGIECGVSAGEPSPELCDGLDNDCDGVADEDFVNLGSACSVGVGICQSSGIFECSADGGGTQCNAVAGLPETETCDGLDNDCDAEIDEDLPPVACTLNVGVCNGSTAECGGVLGYPECNALDYGPNYEITEYSCDDRDNDCDGDTDEGFGLGESCGLGACAGGVVICSGEGGVACSTQNLSSPESCNGEDDDCDGLVDEGC